ncbi:endospore germination permease [Clostridiaceae bacterium UIB06]|uniref:Endospore germination permease n=1 Tax=Clostridium thailandense TaxID=2794346 RepID=A0A949TWR7_9CLOT|nr:endospore germination permease [Clostridium thailandense]MBV7272368.1 endospore germination permease [Clostridium thailandense]MCH5135919.1 endospore germination permease [Clostridiaceae bacterium UIB06]
MNNKEFITPYGLFATIVVTVIGVGVFSLPRDLATNVNTDGWIIALISGIISYFLIYIALSVVENNKYSKFFNILELNFGKIIGSILALIFIIYNIFAVSIGMRVFIEVIKMYLLQRTPTEFLIIITILTGLYLVRGEVGSLIKFNEIAFWVMFLPITFVLLLTLNRTDFTNIFPIFNSAPDEYVKALRSTIYSFGGIEIIYLVLPFMKNKKSIAKVALKSIIFVALFYVIIIIFCLAVFAKEQTKILLWPTITMIKSINIPGAFIERWEGIIMALWVVFYFTTFVNSYYLSSDILKDMLNLHDIKLSSALIVPFIYAIALYPENIAELYDISNSILPYLATFSSVLLPLILFLRKPSKKEVKERGIK